MLRKYYNNNTLSTRRQTQNVATCQILHAKLINMANKPLKVQQPLLESFSERINYGVLPIPYFLQSPILL